MVYIKEYQDKWLSKNPDYMKEWRKKHKEKILEYHKEWVKQHPGYMSEKVQNSRNKKPEYYKEQKREYVKKIRSRDREIEMKFRNRGKHNFGHLRKVNKVYEYVIKRIKDGDIFTVQEMAKDLGIGRTTCIEILQELQETTKGELQYARGSIVVKNVGTNGYGKVSFNNEGVKVKKVPRSTQSRLEKKERVYKYLCDLARENKPIPCLSDMHKDFTDMHLSNLMDILKVLDKEDKIIYKRGKVLAVNFRDVKSETGKTLKYVKQEELEIPVEEEKEEMETVEKTGLLYEGNYEGNIDTDVIASSFGMSDVSITIQEERYDKAVKELVADYILNADINTRDEIVQYVDALLKITDKLKEKLF